jgi:flagellar biosynthesis protein FlhF
LAEAGARLRLEADRPAGRPLTRAAFLGAPGVGRTTALCKWLGMEVFRRGRLGHVVSVEFDRPNPPGPLPVFCEALGVPVARFPASTRPAVPGGFVYFDLPGLSTRDPGENKALADFLAREQIDQRVLVLNAAYDHAALRTAYAAGRALGATHLVFTHLDEVPQWGRLWDYLIDGALEPVFFATGPSLTGDCEEDVSSALVRRTLVPADEAETETEAPAYAIR